jgi:hypothetical protein
VAQDTTADALFAECLALGKAPIALGKGFTECRTWQRTRQQRFLCRVPYIGHSATKKTVVNSSLPSATSAALGKEFFLFIKKIFAECYSLVLGKEVF